MYDSGEAVRRSDIAVILVPDEGAPELYRKEIEKEVKKKEHFILGFASGEYIAFNFARPHSNTEVIMVAPRIIGQGMRDLHERGRGHPVLSVKQDISWRLGNMQRQLLKA